MKFNFIDPKSKEVSLKINQINYKKDNKATIGIVGMSCSDKLSFARILINKGSEIGFLEDQDHPEHMMINLFLGGVDEKTFVMNQVKILVDSGCNILAFPEGGLSFSMVDDILNHVKQLSLVLNKDDLESIDDFALKVLKSSKIAPNYLRPNIYDCDDHDKMIDNLKEDYNRRLLRFTERSKSFEKLSILEKIAKSNVIGVLGGAGPLASVDFCELLNDFGIEYILINNNSAPYKAKYAESIGQSFLYHYYVTKSIFKILGCSDYVMPCNTAHIFTDILQQDNNNISLISIVEATKNYLNKGGAVGQKIILLGTDSTVGIDLSGNFYNGLYDKALENFEIIKPNRVQQDMVMDSIYNVKQGNSKDAKEKIIKVINQIRDSHLDQKIPVILGCTELPVVFNGNELISLNAVSTTLALAQEVHKYYKEFTNCNYKNLDSMSDCSTNDLDTTFLTYYDVSMAFDNKSSAIKLYFSTKHQYDNNSSKISKIIASKNFASELQEHVKNTFPHDYYKLFFNSHSEYISIYSKVLDKKSIGNIYQDLKKLGIEENDNMINKKIKMNQERM